MHIAHLVILIAYFIAGIYCFFWIKRDAEFRAGPWAILGFLSIFLWPVMFLVWLLVRGEEHLTSMAAKQSHRDFQVYMRTKESKDLFANFPDESDTTAQGEKPAEASAKNEGGPGFQDFNIEGLIEQAKWDEALAAARSMRKVAVEMEEEERIYRYDKYIQRIEDARQMEME